MTIVKELKPALIMLLALTIITGLAYPLLVTGVAQTVFPAKAQGSLVFEDGKVVGSALIGQAFNDPRYFWPRPSATPDHPYNAEASSGSNLGPLHPDLQAAVRERADALLASDPTNPLALPADLLTASGSGLDPDISPEAAYWQVSRVAGQRGLEPSRVTDLVRSHVRGRSLGILGEPRVNVLDLNLALDAMSKG